MFLLAFAQLGDDWQVFVNGAGARVVELARDGGPAVAFALERLRCMGKVGVEKSDGPGFREKRDPLMAVLLLWPNFARWTQV